MNPFTVITKFFGSNNASIAESGAGVAGEDQAFTTSGIIRSEITESNLILYKISRDAALKDAALSGLLADSSTADTSVGADVGTASVDIDELKRCGLVLFINDELHTVEIKQVENVAAALVPAVSTASTADNEAVEAIADVPTEDEAASTEEAVETADTVENAEDESSPEVAGSEENDDAGIAAGETDETESETSETVDETADSWTTAIVVLASSVNTQGQQSHQFLPALYEKAIERAVKAGRYEVLTASLSEPEESEEQEPEAESVSSASYLSAEDTAEATITVDTEDTENADNNEEDAEADVEVEEVEVEDTDSDADDTDAEDTEDTETEEAEENGEIGEVGEISDLCDFIIFLIGYLLRCDVFIPNNAQNGRDAHNNSVSGNADGKYVDLTGTELYLVSRSKGVSATGILTSGSKRILVKAGSTVSSDNRLPNQKGQTSSATLRQKLIDDGIIVDGCFASDYEFHSTSAAASVILGQSASGMNTWKDETGRKLETLLGR